MNKYNDLLTILTKNGLKYVKVKHNKFWHFLRAGLSNLGCFTRVGEPMHTVGKGVVDPKSILIGVPYGCLCISYEGLPLHDAKYRTTLLLYICDVKRQ